MKRPTQPILQSEAVSRHTNALSAQVPETSIDVLESLETPIEHIDEPKIIVSKETETHPLISLLGRIPKVIYIS